MNILLVFFAIPIAVITISIALQKIFKSPSLVAAVVFSILLIVTFAAFDINFLVYTIIYTLLSYITTFAVIVISRYMRNINNNSRYNDNNNKNDVFRIKELEADTITANEVNCDDISSYRSNTNRLSCDELNSYENNLNTTVKMDDPVDSIDTVDINRSNRRNRRTDNIYNRNRRRY